MRMFSKGKVSKSEKSEATLCKARQGLELSEARGKRKDEKRKEHMSKDTRPTERSQLPKEEGVTTFRLYSGFTRADGKKKHQEE